MAEHENNWLINVCHNCSIVHVYLSVYLHCTRNISGSASVSCVIFAMCDFTDSLSHIRHMTSRECCLYLTDSNNVSTVMKFSWRVKSDGKAWGNFSSKSFSLLPTGTTTNPASQECIPCVASLPELKTHRALLVLVSFLSTQMKKVMLTVFKHNHGAYQFFREALQ